MPLRVSGDLPTAEDHAVQPWRAAVRCPRAARIPGGTYFRCCQHATYAFFKLVVLFRSLSFISHCVGDFQWLWWTSPWSCPSSSFSRGTAWWLLGKMTATLCFTAGVATEVIRLLPWHNSWDLPGNRGSLCYNLAFSSIIQHLNGKDLDLDLSHIGSASPVKCTNLFNIVKCWAVIHSNWYPFFSPGRDIIKEATLNGQKKKESDPWWWLIMTLVIYSCFY